MIRSIKAALGLSLLAILAVSAMGALSASATTNGHFFSHSPSSKTGFHTVVEGTGTTHSTKLTGWFTEISCHSATYSVHHISVKTVQSLTVTPHYTNCTSSGVAHVRMNGCHYVFTSRTPPGHATAHFVCPAGKKAEVEDTASGSLMKFGAQTPTAGGVTYTNSPDGSVTVNVTAEGIHGECHGGCQLFGTNRTSTLTGAAVVRGYDTETGLTTSVTHT
jgi:hypothetical protein